MESKIELPAGLKIDTIDGIKKLMADKFKRVFKSHELSVMKSTKNAPLIRIYGELTDEFAPVKTNYDPYIEKYADLGSSKEADCIVSVYTNVKGNKPSEKLGQIMADVFESIFGVKAPETHPIWMGVPKQESVLCLYHKRANAPEGEWKYGQMNIRGKYEKLQSDHGDKPVSEGAPSTEGGHISISVIIG
jgi:hypothetical protein